MQENAVKKLMVEKICLPLRYEKHAVVAQLVEHWLPKPRVAGSSPVCRSRQHHLISGACNHSA